MCSSCFRQRPLPDEMTEIDLFGRECGKVELAREGLRIGGAWIALLAYFGMIEVGESRVGRGVSSYSTIGSGPVDHLGNCSKGKVAISPNDEFLGSSLGGESKWTPQTAQNVTNGGSSVKQMTHWIFSAVAKGTPHQSQIRASGAHRRSQPVQICSIAAGFILGGMAWPSMTGIGNFLSQN